MAKFKISTGDDKPVSIKQNDNDVDIIVSGETVGVLDGTDNTLYVYVDDLRAAGVNLHVVKDDIDDEDEEDI